MDTNKRVCNGLDSWEIEAWITRLGSFPIQRITHGIGEENYSCDRAHVLQLENGNVALVTESGCSCYSSEDADIEVFENYRGAMDAYDRWLKGDNDRKDYGK